MIHRKPEFIYRYKQPFIKRRKIDLMTVIVIGLAIAAAGSIFVATVAVLAR